MEIKREIHGEKVSIELTDSEMTQCYFEKQAEFDLLNVCDVIDGWDDEWVIDTYGVDTETYLSLAGKIAKTMRRYIDEQDMEWTFARDEAIEDTIREYKGEKA